MTLEEALSAGDVPAVHAAMEGDHAIEQLLGPTAWSILIDAAPEAAIVVLRARPDDIAGPINGQTLVSVVAAAGRDDLLADLVRLGVDLESRNPYTGHTPLHAASVAGHTSTVRALLVGGAEVDVVDVLGSTPIHDAIRVGSTEVVRALVDAGAPLNGHDGLGWTPLHHAAATGDESILVALLKDGGADPHGVDRNGSTPLHFAASSGHGAAVAQLLAAGANPVVVDDNLATPRDVAADDAIAALIDVAADSQRWPAAIDAPRPAPLPDAHELDPEERRIREPGGRFSFED